MIWLRPGIWRTTSLPICQGYYDNDLITIDLYFSLKYTNLFTL